MIVIDASVLAPDLADDGADGQTARTRLAGETLCAPCLIDLEVTSVWRSQAAAGNLDGCRAASALADLVEMPLQRVDHRSLLSRCWELRHNLPGYDAAYVALAEALDVDLVTGDARLARAPGIECRGSSAGSKCCADTSMVCSGR